MFSFCFIPSEYVPTLFLFSGSRPTAFIAVLISLSVAIFFIFASIFRLSYPLYSGSIDILSIIIPTLFGNSMSLPIILPSMLTLPSVGKIKPQIARRSIVFPLPFLPCNPYIFPLSKDKFMFSRIVFFRIVFV